MKHFMISELGYPKNITKIHPDIDFIFTDNAQPYAYCNGLDLSKYGDEFAIIPKINVSDMKRTNQAAIRTDKRGNIMKNAYGIVVKKYQQNVFGKFVHKEGQFQDTGEDFELFKKLNNHMFDRLNNSSNYFVFIPNQMALGKAALPYRFVEWLKNELYNRFHVESNIQENNNSRYNGYGLKILNIKENNEN